MRTRFWGFATIVALIGLMRLPVLELVPNRDVTTYAVIGRGILDGRSLYSDLWDHKPPGIHVTYAAAIALLGERPEALLLLSFAGGILALAGVWRATSSMDSNPAAAYLAGLLWAAVSGAFLLQGEMPNTEIFANGFLALAFSNMLWNARDQWRPGRAAVTGALFAAASLYKHLLVVVPALLALALICTARRDRRWAALKDCAIWLLVGTMTWMAVGAYFLGRGHWVDFYQAVFVYNRYYGGDVMANLRSGLRPASIMPPFFYFSVLIVAFITVGALASMRRRWREWVLLAAYVTAIGIAIAAPGRGYPHYWLLWLPPLCIGFGWGSAALAEALDARHKVPATVVASLVLVAVGSITIFPWHLSAEARYAARGQHGFAELAALGSALGEALPVSCTFYEVGAETQLYYYSGRQPSSGIFYVYPIKAGPERDRLTGRLLADLHRTTPCLLIVNSTIKLPTALAQLINQDYVATGQSVQTGRREESLVFYARRGWSLPPRLRAQLRVN